MGEVLRRVTRLVAVGLIVASPGIAGTPSPANSLVPAGIALVGSTEGFPDAATGQFTVVVRGLTGSPYNGASVVLDLIGCEDLELCADQLDASTLVNCGAKTMRKFTNVSGAVTFTVLGRSNGGGNASTLLHGAKVYANGTLIGSPTVAAYDLDGQSGIGANDLSAWLTDFGTGNPYGRADYDGSGDVGANDLSFWLSAFGAGRSTSSCASACP
jgi:hypothetical protein